MMEPEEHILSSTPTLDNPIVVEAFDIVISLHDTGYSQGYDDGLTGKPVRNHPEKVPELFKVTYAIGYKVGAEERGSIRKCKEIARHGRRMGWCQGQWTPSVNDNVVKLERVISVEIPQNPSELFLEKKEGFWKKYRVAIFGTLVTGAACFTAGLWVGKTKEQKRSMDVKRTMGVSDNK